MNDTNRPWSESWKDLSDSHALFTRQAERSSDRKCWLFLCALIREHGHLLSDSLSRQAYFVLERYAEGRVSAEDLLKAESWVRLSLSAAPEERATRQHRARVQKVVQALQAALSAALLHQSALRALAPLPEVRGPALSVVRKLSGWSDDWWPREKKLQIDLLLDIFGPPFATPALDTTWREGPGKQPIRMALSIYEDRTFEDLPILADALLDADCPNRDLIDHCQTPGVHGRGCWAVDSLLARG
jgi:hypothetical protein